MSTANKTAAFKARAQTRDTPSLLVLWDALKADPQTSLELLLPTCAPVPTSAA